MAKLVHNFTKAKYGNVSPLVPRRPHAPPPPPPEALQETVCAHGGKLSSRIRSTLVRGVKLWDKAHAGRERWRSPGRGQQRRAHRAAPTEGLLHWVPAGRQCSNTVIKRLLSAWPGTGLRRKTKASPRRQRLRPSPGGK